MKRSPRRPRGLRKAIGSAVEWGRSGRKRLIVANATFPCQRAKRPYACAAFGSVSFEICSLVFL